MSIADFVRENTGVPTGTETIAPVLAGELPEETVTRSNGESYIPGRIEGMSDVEFLQRCRKAGLFLRVKSAPGTGKSAMFDAAFGEEGLFVLCSEGTTEEDLFGGYHPTDTPGKFIWKDGPVTTALREGRPLLLDELNAASPRTATKMNSLFDGRLEILLGNG